MKGIPFLKLHMQEYRAQESPHAGLLKGRVSTRRIVNKLIKAFLKLTAYLEKFWRVSFRIQGDGFRLPNITILFFAFAAHAH